MKSVYMSIESDTHRPFSKYKYVVRIKTVVDNNLIIYIINFLQIATTTFEVLKN